MKIRLVTLASVAFLAAGCSGSGSMFETGSLTGAPASPAPTVAAVDPACTTLATEIETLRSEGTPARLEKVAEGKGTAVVKRTALQKQAQLNKANADYIAQCGPKLQTAAAATPAVPTVATSGAAAAAAKGAMVKTVAAKAPVAAVAATSGVTVDAAAAQAAQEAGTAAAKAQ